MRLGMEGESGVDLGDGIRFAELESSEVRLCYCGSEIHGDGNLCDRCSYLKSVFRPAPREFESKRDVAMRAIAERRDRKMVVME